MSLSLYPPYGAKGCVRDLSFFSRYFEHLQLRRFYSSNGACFITLSRYPPNGAKGRVRARTFFFRYFAQLRCWLRRSGGGNVHQYAPLPSRLPPCICIKLSKKDSGLLFAALSNSPMREFFSAINRQLSVFIFADPARSRDQKIPTRGTDAARAARHVLGRTPAPHSILMRV